MVGGFIFSNQFNFVSWKLIIYCASMEEIFLGSWKYIQIRHSVKDLEAAITQNME